MIVTSVERSTTNLFRSSAVSFVGRRIEESIRLMISISPRFAEFLLPFRWQEERIESTRGTDHDSLRATQEDAETFFFYRRVETADHRAILSCASAVQDRWLR